MEKKSFLYKLDNLPIRTRLLGHFIVFFIIPMMVISMISYFLAFNAIRDRAMKFSMLTVDRTGYEIEELMLDANKISDMIANDPTIQETLRTSLDSDISKRYSTDLKTDSRLNFIESYRTEFFGFYVVGENGGKYKSNYCSIKNEDFKNSYWYKEVVEARKPVCFSTHVDSFVVETAGQSFISVGAPVIDKATGKISGVILIDIEEKVFLNKIKSSQIGKTGFMFVLDSNNATVMNSGHYEVYKLLEKLNSKSKRTGNYIYDYFLNNAGGQSLIMSSTSNLTGWKIGAVVPINEVTSDSKKIGFIIGIMLFIFCVLAIIAAWQTSKSIVNPIQELMLHMKKVEEGNLLVSMKVNYDNEIGELSKSFNIMVQKFRSLVDKVYEEQKNLRKAELKILQAQINPHFLYNTLDSIIWMSRAKRNEDVITMVSALTKLFRIALSKGRDVISIEEEVEHIKSYLTIQHMRYKNKFSYEINIDEGLYKYQTIKLILQPIVENSIYHGVKEKKEFGNISITGKEQDDCIIFSIEDNGKGMTEEQLNALRNTIENKSGNKLNSFGVKNVHERLQIFFGGNYGLTFSSVYGEGTKVEIRIPKFLEADDNVKSNSG